MSITGSVPVPPAPPVVVKAIGDNEVYGLLAAGPAVNRPTAGILGRFYFSTDTLVLERDNGASWDEMARGETAIRLAQLAERAHSSLTGIGAADHHARYTNAEAQAQAAALIAIHAAIAAAHHTKTTDAAEIVSGTFPVARGGTGLNTIALGGILYASALDVLSRLAPTAANQVLRSTAANALQFAALIAADIPNLDAGKITSGAFTLARIPNMDWAHISGLFPRTIADLLSDHNLANHPLAIIPTMDWAHISGLFPRTIADILSDHNLAHHGLGTIVPHDALASLTEKAHGSLTGVTEAQHHARYTDAEVLAVAAALVHAARHQNGGADEISVAGLSGELADNQPPKAHKASHEDTGADEINVAGLLGLLADDQHVLDAEVLAVAAALVHAARHQNGGADEISVAGLSGLLADDQHVLDAEAISAMGAKGDANPLHHDKYTNANAVAAAEAAGLALASGKNIKVISALTADHTWSGLTAVMTAGAALTRGQAVYVGGDSKMELADADAAASMPIVALCTPATLAENAAGEFLMQGFFRDDTWDWTPGGLLYASVTPGALTQTIPSGSGDQVQVVGVAITADIIYFNPSFELVEIS